MPRSISGYLCVMYFMGEGFTLVISSVLIPIHRLTCSFIRWRGPYPKKSLIAFLTTSTLYSLVHCRHNIPSLAAPFFFTNTGIDAARFPVSRLSRKSFLKFPFDARIIFNPYFLHSSSNHWRCSYTLGGSQPTSANTAKSGVSLNSPRAAISVKPDD